MTTQQKIKATLEQSGLPYHEIACYGSQITVECYSDEAAKKWAALLAKFAKIRGTIKTTIDAVANKGTCLNPTQRIIWRVYAAIA